MKRTVMLLMILTTGLCAAARGETDTTKPDPAALKRWQDMRFGMFVHWGPVSLSEQEISWSRRAAAPLQFNTPPGAIVDPVYDNLYKRFNPTNYNAREWVAIAQAAGMKYIVLTAKHHDGFALWPSKARDYNIAACPYKDGKGDIVKDLAEACHAVGLGFGLYYSPRDWTHPDYGVGDNAKYETFMKAQVTELLTQYGQVDVIWWDGFGNRDPIHYWHADQFLKLVRALQPKILSNDRCAVDIRLGSPGLEGDFYTPEQQVGAFDMSRPWESCMTVSAHNRWAWGGAADGVKSLASCLRMLIVCAGGDGNMLLNVGPRPDGAIDPAQAGLLKEIGAWLAQYGESVHGTRGGPFKPGRYGVSTRKDKTVYVHALNWPGGALTLPAIPAKIVGSKALTGGDVTVRQSDEGIEISLPAGDRHAMDTVIALDLDRPAMEIAPLSPNRKVTLTTGKKAGASNVFQNSPAYGGDLGVDGDLDTRWATDAGTKQAWLEVDLGKPVTFSRVGIEEAYAGRVQSFELQAWEGEKWKTFHTGTTIGESFSATFAPITAQRVRLNILVASEGPTISEFQLFAPEK